MDTKVFDAKSLLDNLFDNGILFETGVDGLYGRSGVFEEVIERFERLVTRIGAPDKATRIHFPPGMGRTTLEKSGYMKSFPQLAGCVHSFTGGEREHANLLGMMARGEDWTELQEVTDITLTPAASIRFTRRWPRAGRFPPRGSCSNCRPTASGTSRRAIPPACSYFACASSCTSARANRCAPSAKAGWSGARR